MRLKVLAATMALAVLTSVPGIQAADPPNFDFNGYAIVPTTIGGALTMRSVLTNNGVVPTPILLDFANNQYTLVVTGTLFSIVGIAQNYSPASIEIWEDPIGGGTPADYGNPSTFTDGTLILSGAFDGNLVRNRFTATLGNFVGKVDFTGGSRLGDLVTAQDWPFGGGWSRSVSGHPGGLRRELGREDRPRPGRGGRANLGRREGDLPAVGRIAIRSEHRIESERGPASPGLGAFPSLRACP